MIHISLACSVCGGAYRLSLLRTDTHSRDPSRRLGRLIRNREAAAGPAPGGRAVWGTQASARRRLGKKAKGDEAEGPKRPETAGGACKAWNRPAMHRPAGRPEARQPETGRRTQGRRAAARVANASIAAAASPPSFPRRAPSRPGGGPAPGRAVGQPEGTDSDIQKALTPRRRSRAPSCPPGKLCPGRPARREAPLGAT